MTENMIKFLELASDDQKIQERIAKSKEELIEGIKNIAKDNGIELTDADVISSLMPFDDEKDLPAGAELNEDELEAVSGGSTADVYSCPAGMLGELNGKKVSTCKCVAGGGGTSDEYQKHCACVLGGCGELTAFGKSEAAAGRYLYCGKGSKPVAMYCAIGGQSWF